MKKQTKKIAQYIDGLLVLASINKWSKLNAISSKLPSNQNMVSITSNVVNNEGMTILTFVMVNGYLISAINADSEKIAKIVNLARLTYDI